MKTKALIFILVLSSLNVFSQTINKKSLAQWFKHESNSSNVTYFEVTKKMFDSLNKVYGEEPEVKKYIGQLHSLKMVQATGDRKEEKSNILYSNFSRSTDLGEFTLLMTNNQGEAKMSFYAKESKDRNEYLLISTNMIVYVSGTIDIGSLAELEGIIELAGEAIGL